MEPLLRELRIEVNKRCNFACDHCYTDKKGKISSLSTLLGIVGQCAKSGVTDLSLTGGEPLQDLDRTLALIRAGAELGLRVRLNTNGWYADAECLSSLKAAGLHEIQVSMSHSDATEFDRFVRRKGAFARACEAVRQATNMNLKTTVRCTLMNDNIEQIANIYDLVADLGAHSMKIRAIVEVNGVRDAAASIAASVRVRSIEKLKDRVKQRRVPVALADGGEFSLDAASDIERLACKCGDVAVFVTAEGIITPCPFLRENEDFWCGDIHSQSIESAVSSARYRAFVGHREATSDCGNDAGCACKATLVEQLKPSANQGPRHKRLVERA
ncbi:radical SAM protein [Aquibium carbonis]|uniref:Radical SAM protein n=1 Tax=Aquibium carbonis TaxID=2495581 RepID=A0A3R9Y3B6_9HYPH|nr:radical SAM protein [Aquibium carbonis]RST82041.1 radical SAM protein [Aquibium carbonis]